MRSYILDGKQLMDVSDPGVTEYAAAVYSSATAVKPELIDEEEERDQTKPPSSSLIEHHERLPSRPGLIRPIASRGDTEPPTLLCLFYSMNFYFIFENDQLWLIIVKQIFNYTPDLDP